MSQDNASLPPIRCSTCGEYGCRKPGHVVRFQIVNNLADLVAQAENTETLSDYRQASQALTDAQQALERAADQRCISLARLHQNGHTYRTLAGETGLSYQRVASMVQRGRQLLGLSRTVREKRTPKPAAARFDHDELVEF